VIDEEVTALRACKDNCRYTPWSSFWSPQTSQQQQSKRRKHHGSDPKLPTLNDEIFHFTFIITEFLTQNHRASFNVRMHSGKVNTVNKIKVLVVKMELKATNHVIAQNVFVIPLLEFAQVRLSCSLYHNTESGRTFLLGREDGGMLG
jgi:hypothetical protein